MSSTWDSWDFTPVALEALLQPTMRENFADPLTPGGGGFRGLSRDPMVPPRAPRSGGAGAGRTEGARGAEDYGLSRFLSRRSTCSPRNVKRSGSVLDTGLPAGVPDATLEIRS